MKSLFGILLLLLTTPVLARAANAIEVASAILVGISGLVTTAIPLVFGLVIVTFFWGIFRYVYSQSSEDKMDARGVMLWSLIAVFIMVSIYGIITLLQVTLGVSVSGEPRFTVPQVDAPI